MDISIHMLKASLRMKRSAPEDSVSHGKVKDKGGCKAYDMIERSMNKVYTGY